MKAHELLADRKNWTQGAYALNGEGFITLPRDKDAVCWCMVGAIAKCYPDFNERKAAKCKVLNFLSGSIVEFNDNHTHEEVLAVLKEADV